MTGFYRYPIPAVLSLLLQPHCLMRWSVSNLHVSCHAHEAPSRAYSSKPSTACKGGLSAGERALVSYEAGPHCSRLGKPL